MLTKDSAVNRSQRFRGDITVPERFALFYRFSFRSRNYQVCCLGWAWGCGRDLYPDAGCRVVTAIYSPGPRTFYFFMETLFRPRGAFWGQTTWI